MSRIRPAGSMTFLPKIHGPVSTTMKLPPASLVASSTLPMSPSVASTLKPLRSMFGAVCVLNVHISMVAINTPPRGPSASFASPLPTRGIRAQTRKTGQFAGTFFGVSVAARSAPRTRHEVEHDVHCPDDDRRPDERAKAVDLEAVDQQVGQPEHQHRHAEPDQS